jgi:hypothetical protein
MFFTVRSASEGYTAASAESGEAFGAASLATSLSVANVRMYVRGALAVNAWTCTAPAL